MTLSRNPSLYSAFNRQRLVQYFFFGVFLLLLWQVLRILAPFYIALIGSAVLSLLIYPMHTLILRRMKNHHSAAAACSTTLVVLIVVIPILLCSWVFIRETSKIYPVVKEMIERTQTLRDSPMPEDNMPDALGPLWEKASALADALNVDPKEIVLNSVDELSQTMTHKAARLIRSALLVGFNLLILIFTLFFFLRDGPHIIERTVELIPMAPEHKRAILERLKITLSAVIRGVLVVALIQGVLAGTGFALFGVPFPIQLGALTALLAPIPIVGSIGVWGMVVLGLLLNADYQKALYVFLWNSGTVILIDHFLRPVLISSEAKIPMLLLFFSMLGGLHVYGFTGLLLGPVIVALLLAFVNIYRREYRWLLTASKED